MKKILIIGGGSFGTALSTVLIKNLHDVLLYDIDKKLINEIEKNRVNKKYLPNVKVDKRIKVTSDLIKIDETFDIILFSVPCQVIRKALDYTLKNVNLSGKEIFVNVSKGIEIESLKLPFEIIKEELIKNKQKGLSNNIVHLAGPSHAEEVSLFIPTALLASSDNENAKKVVINTFSNDFLRIYSGNDILGASLSGAVKNVIALGCGISDGLGLGDNTIALIMTRGLNEITRLGVKLGGKKETFSGLSGVGDLIVTCTSLHSRNKRAGILIGEGKTAKSAIKKVGMVVEGMSTSVAVIKLAKKLKIEMPICESIYKICYKNLNAKNSIKKLMKRKLKKEFN